jgi:phosphatidylglycerophosphate synthase
MGKYRARDLLRVPSLISLTRIPLAGLFIWGVDRPVLALVTLLAAGLSDVLDGSYARRFGQVTATGAVVDGITDKVFMLSVVLTLLLSGRLSPPGALMLGTRELGELPLVVWWAVHRVKRRARAENPRANALGKLCTSLQFTAIMACLLESEWLWPLLWVAAAAGVASAVHYWKRELGGPVARR